MTKAEIRAQITGLRKAAASQDLKMMSANAVRNLRNLDCFHAAATVGIYMPLPDEVDILPVLQIPEKTFFIPAIDESCGSYRMAQYTSELRPGKFGIPEPMNPVFAKENDLDLIVVPGIAFDFTGWRVGRGGGFYDRLLPQYHALRAGICFHVQILDHLPVETHDCRMDFVVTESQIFKVCDEH